MTEQEMVNALKYCGRGSILFVSYVAGRPATKTAVAEAPTGMSRRHFVGSLESLWKTRKGDIVLTIFAFNRGEITERGLRKGGYRTFNPNVGKLISIEVIDAKPNDRVRAIYEASLDLDREELSQLRDLMFRTRS